MSKAKKHFTIKHLEKETGIRSENIRFYERKGLIEPVERSEAGYRLYNNESLKHLKFIQECREANFTLAEIKQLLQFRNNPSQHTKEEVYQFIELKVNTLEASIQSFQKASIRLKELLDECKRGTSSVEDCEIISGLEG